MLKITGLPNKPALSKNNGSKLVFSRNNNSKSVFRKNNGNSEVDKFGGNVMEYAKKSGKSKGQKLAKSQKLSKLGKSKGKKSKKPFKIGNAPNFDVTETGSNFLIFGARETFNYLRLVLTKALILQYYDPECHILIKINALGYAIGKVVSLIASEIRQNRVVTKTDLS